MNEQKKHDKLTNEEVEYRIAKAVVKNVPDLYEEAANTPVTPLAMVDNILPRQYPRQKRVLPRLAAACLLLVLFGGSFFAYTWFSVKAILSIEVNPSVALSINRYERVIDARAMNSDGDDLLDELSLKGLKLETAMDALMGAMNRKGYLQDGGNIHLFVDGNDENFNQELYEEVDEMLAHLAPNMVTDNVTEESSDSSATILSEDEVKQIALQHASLSDSQVTFHDLSLESDDQQKIYHLSFYTDSEEYEYTIDAISGEILSYDHDIKTFLYLLLPLKQRHLHQNLFLSKNRSLIQVLPAKHKSAWIRQNKLHCKKPVWKTVRLCGRKRKRMRTMARSFMSWSFLIITPNLIVKSICSAIS